MKILNSQKCTENSAMQDILASTLETQFEKEARKLWGYWYGRKSLSYLANF